MKIKTFELFFLLIVVSGAQAVADGPNTVLKNGDFLTEHEKSTRDWNASKEHLKNAGAFMNRKMYSQAIAEYDETIHVAERVKDNPLSLSRDTLCQAYVGKGDVYMAMKDYKSAVDSYNDACLTKPKYSSHFVGKAQVGLGEAFFQLAQLSDAASAYSKLLSNSEGMFVFGMHYSDANKADQYFRTGESEKAAKLFHKAYLAGERDRRHPARFYSDGDSTESKLNDMQSQIDFLKWHR